MQWNKFQWNKKVVFCRIAVFHCHIERKRNISMEVWVCHIELLQKKRNIQKSTSCKFTFFFWILRATPLSMTSDCIFYIAIFEH